MRFDYDGKIYYISFKREGRLVGPLDAQHPSRFPYTTATIDVGQIDPLLRRPVIVAGGWRTATVGCWHREKVFSTEKGRVLALRQITRTIPKDMKPLLWKAYLERKK